MDWDQRWKEHDTPWDHGEAAPPLREFLERHSYEPGRALVPGCGSGHDVRLLDRFGFQATGLDVSETALKVAESMRNGGSEAYARGDWLELDASWNGTFDWVVEHTCFCAIAPSMRARYASSCRGVLRPGGFFLAVFYLNPAAESGPPFACARGELDRLFGPFFELVREWKPTRTFPSREGRELCRLYQKCDSR